MNWKYNDGSTKEMSELTTEELNDCLVTIQKRQVHIISKLRMGQKLEKALKEEAKKRKITLEGLTIAENPKYSKSFNREKELIATVNRSFSIKEKKVNGTTN